MTREEIKLAFKERASNYKILVGTPKKVTISIILMVLLFLSPLLLIFLDVNDTFLCFYSPIISIITIFVSIKLKKSFDKIFYNKYKEKCNFQKTNKFVAESEIEIVQKYFLKELLGDLSKNKDYISKLRLLLLEEMKDSKVEISAIKLPLFGVVIAIIAATVNNSIIQPQIEKVNSINLINYIVAFFCVYIVMGISINGYKLSIETWINSKHARLKKIHLLLGDLELEIEEKK